MSEPTRISKEEIQRLLDTITRTDITPEDEQELDEALAAAQALLGHGWAWYICKPCPFCGQTAVIALPTEGVEKIKAGESPQDALPGMSRDQWELVKTGIHPECWETLLPPEEDE